MKKVCIILLILSVLVGCSTEIEGESNQSPDWASQEKRALSQLTIATMPALETFPIFIASIHGFFEDEGLEVNLEQFFSPGDRDIAFQTNENIDGMSFDLVQLAVYREAGIGLVATTSTIGMASVIGGHGVYTIEDLKGQSVLMTSNTSMDYILDRALAAFGLTVSDIITDEVPALPIRLEMLLNNQSAGAILPDPFAAMALYNGFNLITTTTELDINPFIIAFRKETTVDKLEELQAFYRAINNAVDFLNTANREEFIDALIEVVGYPQSVRDTLVVPHFPQYAVPQHKVVQDVLDFAVARGLLTIETAVEDVIFDIGN